MGKEMKYNITRDSGRQEVTSEIQPWGLEFLRFDQLWKAADELAIEVRSYKVELIHRYWVVLYQLYIMMLPYITTGSLVYYEGFVNAMSLDKNIDISEKQKIKYDKGFNERVEEEMEEWEEDKLNGIKEVPKKLIKLLTSYHKSLMKTKQFVGLGVPMAQTFNTKSKLKNALLGKT